MTATNVAKGPGAQYHGTGSPVASLVAPTGSTYQDSAGGVYTKSGGGAPYSDGTDWTNLGWSLVGASGGQPLAGATLHVDGATYLSTPAPAFTPTTGLAMYWVGTPDTLASGATQTLIASTGFGTTDRSRQLLLNGSGKLSLTYSTDGATNVTVTQATAIPGAGNGVTIGLGATFLFDNGSGGGTVTWYYSTDLGATWSTFGSPTTTTGTTAVHSTNKATTVGLSTALTQPFIGNIIKAWELNAIGGSILSSVDLTGHWSGTDAQGNVWTLNGSGYYWADPYNAAATAATIAAGDAATLVSAKAYTDAAIVVGTGAQYAYLASDVLLTQSNVTLQNVTGLAATVAASAVYEVSGWVEYDSSQTADLKLGWTAPAGATFHWATDGLKGGATTSIDTQSWVSLTVSQTSIVGGNGVGTLHHVRIAGTLIMSTTAGTLQLQAAQGVVDATQTTVRTGSRITVTRIA